MNSPSVIARSSDNSAGLTRPDLAALNEAYAPLDFAARIARIYQDFAPDKVLVTSSFAATSAYFLHIISTIAPGTGDSLHQHRLPFSQKRWLTVTISSSCFT
jgi:phosphoadenosine phosphosulfate reductase